jgi:hypothetical protein
MSELHIITTVFLIMLWVGNNIQNDKLRNKNAKLQAEIFQLETYLPHNSVCIYISNVYDWRHPYE